MIMELLTRYKRNIASFSTLVAAILSAILFAGAVTSSSDHVIGVRWTVDEEQEAGSVLGDLRTSLAEHFDPATLAGYVFKFLPRPNQDLAALVLERFVRTF